MKFLVFGMAAFVGSSAFLAYKLNQTDNQLMSVLAHENECVTLLKQCVDLLEDLPDSNISHDLTVDGGMLEDI